MKPHFSFGVLTAICSVTALLLTASISQAQKESPSKDQTQKIIGADISFLPQLEDEGKKFSVNDVQGDAIQILKEHGFNYIRLRIL